MKNNKGFSLVELIIVIAIMAVLVGILAPTYMQYVEKSKKSNDVSTVDSIVNAIEVAAIDPETQGDTWTQLTVLIDDTKCTITNQDGKGAADSKMVKSVEDIVGTDCKFKSSQWGSAVEIFAKKGSNGKVDFSYGTTSTYKNGTDAFKAYATSITKIK